MKNLKIAPVWATPFLFGLFPILSLYSHNFEQIVLTETFVPVLSVWFLVLVLVLVLRAILKDDNKASILTAVFVILFFGHGYVVRGFGKAGIKSEEIALAAWVITFIAFAVFVIRSKRDWTKEIALLHVMGWGLIVFSFVPILWYLVTVPTEVVPLNRLKPMEVKITGKGDLDHQKPDIYYMIFDRYAGNTVLTHEEGYDNSPFLNSLKAKGFYVAEHSRPNYSCTIHSLLSSLNMMQIDDLRSRVDDMNKKRVVPIPCKPNLLYGMLQDYRVGRFLKSQGYKLIHVGSWWRPTQKNALADVNYNKFLTTEFLKILYEDTPLPLIGQGIRQASPVYMIWKGNLETFDTVAEIADRQSSPKFVFVHFLVPHPPYIYDEEGNFVPRRYSKGKPRSVSFIRQLKFTNHKIEVMVDHILKVSKKPPIIIIQADEGPYPTRFEDGTGGEIVPDWSEATNREIWIKNGDILNTLYLPGFDKKQLYPAMTPVNTFRLVFNHYFGTSLEKQPDRTYTYIDIEAPCEFQELTDRLDQYDQVIEKEPVKKPLSETGKN